MFIISFIYSYEIIKVVAPEPCVFFQIPASMTEAAALISNGTSMYPFIILTTYKGFTLLIFS